MIELGIILASVREARRGEAFAGWIHSLAAARPDLHAELIDLREWPIPPYAHKTSASVAEKGYAPESLSRRWHDKIAGLDAIIVVTPEYGHGYPGALKNALDQIYAPWSYKPIGFVSYGGFAAGARAVEQLRMVAIELRMVAIRDEVNVRLMGLDADERGWPREEIYRRRGEAMIEELGWMGAVMKEARARRR